MKSSCVRDLVPGDVFQFDTTGLDDTFLCCARSVPILPEGYSRRSSEYIELCLLCFSSGKLWTTWYAADYTAYIFIYGG